MTKITGKDHLWKPGVSANPRGCPKGAHHVGRPAKEVKEIAEQATPAIVRRWVRIALGESLEQVVNGEGEVIQIPAPIREQLKAGESVVKLGVSIDVNSGSGLSSPEDSVRNATIALKIIRELEKNGVLAA